MSSKSSTGAGPVPSPGPSGDEAQGRARSTAARRARARLAQRSAHHGSLRPARPSLGHGHPVEPRRREPDVPRPSGAVRLGLSHGAERAPEGAARRGPRGEGGGRLRADGGRARALRRAGAARRPGRWSGRPSRGELRGARPRGGLAEVANPAETYSPSRAPANLARQRREVGHAKARVVRVLPGAGDRLLAGRALRRSDRRLRHGAHRRGRRDRGGRGRPRPDAAMPRHRGRGAGGGGRGAWRT